MTVNSIDTSDDIYFAKDAIIQLARQCGELDTSMSSHWRKMHRDFGYDGKNFTGLTGFGQRLRRSRGARKYAHWLFQRRYRRKGSGLASFPQIMVAAQGIAKRQERQFDIDILRQALTLAFVEKYGVASVGGRFVVIGDGFGTLSTLILECVPGSQVVVVNLTRTLLVDLTYIQAAAPQSRVALVSNEVGLSHAISDNDVNVIAVRADHQALLAALEPSIVFNVASMQEMDPHIIADYFGTLRNMKGGPTLFYCCNRIEKALPDGTITRFDDYPWHADDEVLVDEHCPWHQDYYSFRPPFYRPYDGPIRHRLVRLSAGGSETGAS